MVGVDAPPTPPGPEETFPGSGILKKDAGGPVPPPETVHPGNGFEAYQQALASLPQPSVRAKRQLNQLAKDPKAELDEEATTYVRACWPSLQLLQQAACSSGFERVGAPTDENLLAPRHLALAALARGRMEIHGGAPAMGARWPLFVIKLGHNLLLNSPFMESQVALSVCKLSETWLQRSLQAQPWSEKELSWLADRLQALRDARPASSTVTDAKGLPEDKREQAHASHERLFATELAALTALCERLEKNDDDDETTAKETGDAH